MRKVVYTCIFGDYDDLKEPTVISDGWEYICFTNQDLKSDVWQIVNIDSDVDNKIMCRRFWIYPYDYLKGYDIALSIGGQIQIKCDLNDYLKDYDYKLLGLLKHPTRHCVYQELITIALRRKDTWESVIKTAEYYSECRMPENNGLYATGITVRDLNNDSIKRFCSLWLKELELFSHRDQLSLAFAVWKYQFEAIKLFNFNDILGTYFELKKHK